MDSYELADILTCLQEIKPSDPSRTLVIGFSQMPSEAVEVLVNPISE